MKEIKQQFFALRNGLLAEQLRKAGVPHKMIFGLNIPQIAEIARTLSPSMELAETLWDETENRESRLLATYLFPPEEVNPDKALSLLDSVRSAEEADMLAFRLLKRLPFASELASSPALSPLQKYARKSLLNHLK